MRSPARFLLPLALGLGACDFVNGSTPTPPTTSTGDDDDTASDAACPPGMDLASSVSLQFQRFVFDGFNPSVVYDSTVTDPTGGAAGCISPDGSRVALVFASAGAYAGTLSVSASATGLYTVGDAAFPTVTLDIGDTLNGQALFVGAGSWTNGQVDVRAVDGTLDVLIQQLQGTVGARNAILTATLTVTP